MINYLNAGQQRPHTCKESKFPKSFFLTMRPTILSNYLFSFGAGPIYKIHSKSIFIQSAHCVARKKLQPQKRDLDGFWQWLRLWLNPHHFFILHINKYYSINTEKSPHNRRHPSSQCCQPSQPAPVSCIYSCSIQFSIYFIYVSFQDYGLGWAWVYL